MVITRQRPLGAATRYFWKQSDGTRPGCVCGYYHNRFDRRTTRSLGWSRIFDGTKRDCSTELIRNCDELLAALALSVCELAHVMQGNNGIDIGYFVKYNTTTLVERDTGTVPQQRSPDERGIVLLSARWFANYNSDDNRRVIGYQR